MCDKIRKQKLQELIEFSQELDLYNIQENESKEQKIINNIYKLIYEKYFDLLVYGEFKISTGEIKNILKEDGWTSTKNQN